MPTQLRKKLALVLRVLSVLIIIQAFISLPYGSIWNERAAEQIVARVLTYQYGLPKISTDSYDLAKSDSSVLVYEVSGWKIIAVTTSLNTIQPLDLEIKHVLTFVTLVTYADGDSAELHWSVPRSGLASNQFVLGLGSGRMLRPLQIRPNKYFKGIQP